MNVDAIFAIIEDGFRHKKSKDFNYNYK